MNFFTALNFGDASIKEAHLTSLLYYLFRETSSFYPQNSFVDYFNRFYNRTIPSINDCDFNFNDHIKIEQILNDRIQRRDLDVSILFNSIGNRGNVFLNIENKISQNSFNANQINDQNALLVNLYQDYTIINNIILPYQTNDTVIENANVIYWIGDENSLSDIILNYLESLIQLNDNHINFFRECISFIENFQQEIEEDKLSSINSARGPRTRYRRSMAEYLQYISDNWEALFVDMPNVTVNELLARFEQLVTSDLRQDYPNDFQNLAQKFSSHTLLAQPKIFTINEQNRVHHKIYNSISKQIFYYPDFPDGITVGSWRSLRIKPLRLLNENNRYVIYYRDSHTDETLTAYYNN